MTNERKGEIALLLWKSKMRREGINFPEDVKREIHNEAQKIGVKPSELMNFFKEITKEVVDEALN